MFAEYDQSFIQRVLDMADEEIFALLHALPDVDRKVMVAAISWALSQQAMQEHIDDLNGRLTN